MVHAVHRSIQVYQDFQRQTLSHLEQLEQASYKLMPQFELEQVLSMVERSHQIKAGARYLQLQGIERLAHHLKGRYMALAGLSMPLERDLLKLLIQMQEIFRLCFLTQASTWQVDLETLLSQLATVFQNLDAYLTVAPNFNQDLLNQEQLKLDIQRLLVATVLIPELARLDMMLKNTPASKLSEILLSQLPRLQTLAYQLDLGELQRSMQVSLLEIQARPSFAKEIGTQALLTWSDLCYQHLPQGTTFAQLSAVKSEECTFAQVCAMDLEECLMGVSVALIDASETHLATYLQTYAQQILAIAQQHQVVTLAEMTQLSVSALRYHPDRVSLVGRLSLQNWLWYQLHGLHGHFDSNVSLPFHSSEALRELAVEPVPSQDTLESYESDAQLLDLLTQVSLPDVFQRDLLEANESDPIQMDWRQIERLSSALHHCQRELEQLSTLPVALQQGFPALLNEHYRLITLPLSDVFNRFQPMVDALALQGYKEIKLKLVGGSIRIHRYKAEKLYELLLVLISYAVVHGLEKVDERVRDGKRRQALLMLSAYVQGDRLQFELRDDGRGLNFELLREWSIQHYKLSPAEAQFLTETEILNYVFQTSDAPAPDNIIGLGSVQGLLNTLDGSIEVSTVLGQGTTVRLSIPKLMMAEPQWNWTPTDLAPEVATPLRYDLSASVPPTFDVSLESLRHQGAESLSLYLETQGLFLWADDLSVYVLDCDRIEEYVMPHVTQAHQAQTQLNWRDQVIPLFSLQDFLGGQEPTELAADEDVILVIKGEQQLLALRAPMQHLVSVSKLTINPLSQALAAPRYIYGTTTLAETPSDVDEPRLVVDVAALIAQQPLPALWPLPISQSVGEHAQDMEVDDPESPEYSPDGPQILVVDDSRTAREIVSMTLRQGGYRVLHAKDGVDALAQLQAQQADQCLVDLVISDVAMPRMNGLEFLRRCRQETFLQQIPIAMLSNCDSTTHSDLAMREGANAYLTKPYDETEFLAAIANLLESSPQSVAHS